MLIAVLLVIVIASCSKTEQKNENLIGPKKVTVANGIMTPEILWSFGRLGEIAVSPNGKRVLFTTTWYSIEQNKSNSELYIMNADGSDKKQLTFTSAHENNPTWVDDNRIAYLSEESGLSQIWVMNADGSNKKMISSFESDINGFQISPKGDKVLFISEVKVDKNTVDIYPDLPKTTGMIINDLMYRHWDVWEDGLYSHVFVADFTDGIVKNAKDLMPNQPYDSPEKPFGGMEEISWTPDGKEIAYTCKMLKGKEYAFSTNTDIYLYNLENGNVKNLTEGMPGYDKAPVFSPDGSKMIWL